LRPVFEPGNIRIADRVSGYGRHALRRTHSLVAAMTGLKKTLRIQDLAYIWRGEDAEFAAPSLEPLLWPVDGMGPRSDGRASKVTNTR
jgi:hypothetical protein